MPSMNEAEREKERRRRWLLIETAMSAAREMAKATVTKADPSVEDNVLTVMMEINLTSGTARTETTLDPEGIWKGLVPPDLQTGRPRTEG